MKEQLGNSIKITVTFRSGVTRPFACLSSDLRQKSADTIIYFLWFIHIYIVSGIVDDLKRISCLPCPRFIVLRDLTCFVLFSQNQ